MVFNDGNNFKFLGLGRVGTYWDYAGSSVPAWVSGCTTPPYLNCDGTTFSSATYPQLTVILGGTTLPDSKGRARFTLNQGSGRITSSGGIDGNTAYASGGVQTNTLSATNLPSLAHTHQIAQLTGASWANFTNSQDPGGTSVPFGNVPPGYVGGLTLIRAA